MSDGFLFFNEKTAGTFRAVAERVVPSEGGLPGAGSDASLRAADKAIAERDEELQKNVALFLKVVELAPLFRYGRPFSKLSPDRQDAALRFFSNNRVISKFRQGFWGLKTFALLGYYVRRDVWKDLDYLGPRLDAPYYQNLQADGGAKP